jgi:alpha-L-fucosidase 2
MGSEMETTINSTMDFAIVKEVLSNLIEGAQIVNKYTGEIEKWKEMLERIPPYEINEDGAIKEWMHPYFDDNYHHRHQSHIYPVFPGTEVTEENDSQLYEAFKTAIKKRMKIGLKEQTGWSLAHMANIYARMGQGDLALECLNLISQSCVTNNFYTLHNDWRNMGIGVDMPRAFFQIDANMGWSAAIQEMLLFSIPGKISILPALPKKWRQGKVGSLLTRGGIEVDLKWDQDQDYVLIELKSLTKDQTIELAFPGKIKSEMDLNIEENKVCNLDLEKGQKQRFKFNIEW